MLFAILTSLCMLCLVNYLLWSYLELCCSSMARDITRICINPQKEDVGWQTGILQIWLDYSVGWKLGKNSIFPQSFSFMCHKSIYYYYEMKKLVSSSKFTMIWHVHFGQRFQASIGVFLRQLLNPISSNVPSVQHTNLKLGSHLQDQLYPQTF